MRLFGTTPSLFSFLSFFHLFRNTVGHNELITRPAWLRMVAASPRINAANPQIQAHSDATERSFWHIRAKLILVWTYFGCFEALPQQACLWRTANLCWVRSKSKSEMKNQQTMKLSLAGNFIRQTPQAISQSSLLLCDKLCDHKDLAVHLWCLKLNESFRIIQKLSQTAQFSVFQSC